MGHADFRVRGKIFATLGSDEDWAGLKLTPDEQRIFVRSEPVAFQPFKGAWGRRGYTRVVLVEAGEASVRQAVIAAWRREMPMSRRGSSASRSRPRVACSASPSAIARWIAEREGKPLAADGSLTVEHPLADPEWAVRHVLQYGPDAEVVEPESVRSELKVRLAALAEGSGRGGRSKRP